MAEKGHLYRSILRRWEVPCDQSDEEAWRLLEERISQARERRVIPWWKYAAAAAVLVFVVLNFFDLGSPSSIQVQTLKGQHKNIGLPDGSEAVLDAGSSVSYASEWKEGREVFLKGRAFFDVRKGEQFKVSTEEGEVLVLGTSFDVNSHDGRFEVACRTGKVLVSRGGEEIIVLPGQVARWNGQSFERMDARRPADADWVRGEFEFEDVPVEVVWGELERQFNLEIQAHGIGALRYTGGFDLADPAEALRSVCLPLGLDFEQTDARNVRITRAGLR